jgi:2-polyprenyl-6-methoxyphenol hydroxylase-like FAD-dependent oxidoreductase
MILTKKINKYKKISKKNIIKYKNNKNKCKCKSKYKNKTKYNKIQKGGSGKTPDEKEINIKKAAKDIGFDYIPIKGDGWCYYYAILQGLYSNSNESSNIKEAIVFAKQIAEWFKDNENETKYDYTVGQSVKENIEDVNWQISGKDNTEALKTEKIKFADFLNYIVTPQTSKQEDSANGFIDPGPLIWADYGIFSQAAADVKNININLYEIKNDKILLKNNVPEYKPSDNKIPINTINLIITGDPQNHFDLLVPKNIIIIGAGPVGLFCAVQLIESKLNYNINIYESRIESSYNDREQMLFIREIMFEKLPKAIRDKLLEKDAKINSADVGDGCKILMPPIFNENLCFTKDININNALGGDSSLQENKGKYGYSIMTSRLQTVLKDYIDNPSNTDGKNIKINFNSKIVKIENKQIYIKKNILETNILETNIEDFDILIVSSGNKLDNDLGITMETNDEIKQKEFYGAIINIDVEDIQSITDKLNRKLIDDNSKVPTIQTNLNQFQHKIRFFRQQKNKIYIGINISKTDYDSWSGIGNERINSTTNSDVFDMIKNIIGIYINNTVNDNEITIKKFTVIPITVEKISQSYHKYDDDKIVFFAGDSAIKGHFFTAFGMNFGIESIVKIISTIATIATMDIKSILDEYQKLVDDNYKIAVDSTKATVGKTKFIKDCNKDDIIEFLKDKTNIKKEHLLKLRKEDLCTIASTMEIPKQNKICTMVRL